MQFFMKSLRNHIILIIIDLYVTYVKYMFLLINNVYWRRFFVLLQGSRVQTELEQHQPLQLQRTYNI